MKETREEKLDKWRKASKEMNENPKPMNKENTAAKEYLKDKGLDPNNVRFSAFCDGCYFGLELPKLLTDFAKEHANKRVQEALEEVLSDIETGYQGLEINYEQDNFDAGISEGLTQAVNQINQIKTKYK